MPTEPVCVFTIYSNSRNFGDFILGLPSPIEEFDVEESTFIGHAELITGPSLESCHTHLLSTKGVMLN